LILSSFLAYSVGKVLIGMISGPGTMLSVNANCFDLWLHASAAVKYVIEKSKIIATIQTLVVD